MRVDFDDRISFVRTPLGQLLRDLINFVALSRKTVYRDGAILVKCQSNVSAVEATLVVKRPLHAIRPRNLLKHWCNIFRRIYEQPEKIIFLAK